MVAIKSVVKFPADVVAGDGIAIERSGATYTFSITSTEGRWTATGDDIYSSNDGGVGIGTVGAPNAGAKLHVVGGILTTSAFTSTTAASGGIDYLSGLRLFSVGATGSTKGTLTFIAKGADDSSATRLSIDASGVLTIGAYGAGILETDASGVVAASSTTGSGAVVRATSPTLVTPALGTPSALVLTNATGLPIGGLTGLGTGVATALAVNVGSAGAFVVNGGALGSPSSAGTIPAFTLGGTIAGGGNQLNNIIVGTTTPLAGSFTTVAASTSVTVTSASANALTAGRQGATAPALQVDASTATSATGLKVKSAAAAGGLALSVITSGTNEALTIDAAGSGTITLGGTSTGAITLTRATTLSAALTYGGVTLTNSVQGTGQMVLATSPALTTPALGTPTAGVLSACTTATQTVNDNSTKLASTAYVDGAYAAYTPTLSAVGGGSLGTGNTPTGRWRQQGKTVFFSVAITIGASGKDTANYLGFTLPTGTAAAEHNFMGRDSVGGFACFCNVGAGGSVVTIYKYDGTSPLANSHAYFLSGSYELT